MGVLSTSRFLSCERLPCVASVRAGRMEDEEAKIGALGEDEGKLEGNEQRISIEDENAAGDESLAAKEGNIRVPSNAIPHRHAADYPNQMTITNQGSWQIEGNVNWEDQLRRHQQKQVSRTKKWELYFIAT